MPEQEFGSDGQLHDVDVQTVEPVAAEPVAEPVDSFEASEPGSASQRLRAFEDEHFGENAPRISGKLERGHGSLFSRLPVEKQKAHAAIEKVVGTEQKLADARAAVLAAESEHDAAVAAAEDASRFGG